MIHDRGDRTASTNDRFIHHTPAEAGDGEGDYREVGGDRDEGYKELLCWGVGKTHNYYFLRGI